MWKNFTMLKSTLPKILRVAETYHFVTDWRFRAPLQKVWSVVLDIERYPGWWKNFRRGTSTRGVGKSVGSAIECEVRGSLPYGPKTALGIKGAASFGTFPCLSTGNLSGTG